MTYSVCGVIPHFNHALAVGKVVEELRKNGLQVLIVDDASRAPHRERLAALEADGVSIIYREVNGGKGAAVVDGLRAAWRNGYSHALQVDADGQHELTDIKKLLDLAQEHPKALVTARPIFHSDAPRSRVLGRKLTDFWVSIETMSFPAPDTMCGFRVYPLQSLVPLLGCYQPASRMGFDIEVIVRAVWEGVEVLCVPSRVSYPSDGVSHFRPLLDNLMISLTHSRLVVGGLLRLPWFIASRIGFVSERMRGHGR